MKKIFVSYSREDYLDEKGQIIADSPVSEIVEALKAAPEIEVWIDVTARYSGQYFTSILAKRILWGDKILFLSSKNSNASEWVSKELLFAYNNKKEIVPVLLDDTPYNLDFALFLTGIDHIEYYKTQNLSYIIENLVDSNENAESQSPIEKGPSPKKKKEGCLLKTNYKGCALTLSIAFSLFIVFGVFLNITVFAPSSSPMEIESAAPEGVDHARPEDEIQDLGCAFPEEEESTLPRDSIFPPRRESDPPEDKGDRTIFILWVTEFWGDYAILEWNEWNIIDGDAESLKEAISSSEGKEKRLVLIKVKGDDRGDIIEQTFSAGALSASDISIDKKGNRGYILKCYNYWKKKKR